MHANGIFSGIYPFYNIFIFIHPIRIFDGYRIGLCLMLLSKFSTFTDMKVPINNEDSNI